MAKIIYQNNLGESIEFKNSRPFFLEKIEGIGAVQNIIHTQKSNCQHGSTVVGKNLDNRYINIQGTIIAKNKQEIMRYRRKLVKAFNPMLKSYLIFKENGIEDKKINCEIESAPVFNKGNNKFQKFVINLMCPNPFWEDNYITSEEMSYLLGGLNFKLSLPTRFSERSFKKKLINDGDVETPIKIEFHGPAINPTIKNNTTNEFIIVKRELTEEDILLLDTTFGDKKVEILRSDGIKENAFNYIDLASTFFNLQLGENEIEYNSNNDSKKTKVIIKYKNRYLGV